MNILHTQGLTVQLGQGHHTALQDVSVAIPQGRWTCVVGPNGAGKSTLLKAMADLLPTQGSVWLQGQDIAQVSATQRAKQLAWLGQMEAPLLDLRVHDVVGLGRLPHLGWWGANTPQDLQAIDAAMAQMHVEHLRHTLLGELSGGERQRVLLARALAVQAQVLLMDEPLAHLDPPHQVQCLQTLQQLVAQGVTVVTVLHDIHLALYAQHLVVLEQGKVVCQGASHDTQVHQHLNQVFQGCLDIRQVGEQWVALPKL
jgi:iron complex transport system ATP-binding protein